MAQALEIPHGFDEDLTGSGPQPPQPKPVAPAPASSAAQMTVPAGFDESLTEPTSPTPTHPAGFDEPHVATPTPIQTQPKSSPAQGPSMGAYQEKNPLKQIKETISNLPIAPGVKKTFGDVGHEAYSIAANAAHRIQNPVGMTDEEHVEARQGINNYFDRHLQKDLETIGPDNGAWSKKFSIATDKAGIGVAKGVSNFALEMTSPFQIGLMYATGGESALSEAGIAAGLEPTVAMPLAKTISKLAQAKFTADMAQGSYEGINSAVDAAKKGDWEGMAENATEGIISGLMARGAMSHEQASAHVKSDLEQVARQQFGDVQGGFTRPLQSRFDQLNPYQQAQVIDETVKKSPEYKAVLDDVEKQDAEAKDRSKQQNRGKLDEYYSHAIEHAWEPDVTKRAMRGLEKGRQARRQLQYDNEVQNVRDEAQQAVQEHLKAIRDQYETQRKEAREARLPARQQAADNRSQVGKVASSIETERNRIWDERQESSEPTSEVPTRTVESYKDDQGNILYPAQFWGEDNTFGVASDTAGHAIYRQTPRGVEWLTPDGNFMAEPDQVYFTPDPSHADTIARLTALDANASSLAEADGATPEQKKDASEVGDIRRQLINGEVSAEEARKKSGIAEGTQVSDEYVAAREGKLNGPFHESNRAQWQEGIEKEARELGLGDDEVASIVDHESLLARQQTQQNLNHVYRPGDYIVSKGDTRWTLDSKGMLYPDDGGGAVPLMKRGLYSNDAMQLAGSGRVGYGTETREQRRVRQSREREAEQDIKAKQDEVNREMRLAQQREGLQLASEAEPRADVGEKEERRSGFLSRPPRAPQSPVDQIVRLAFQAPKNADSVIASIARNNDISPEDVMRLALANDPERANTPEAKVARLNVGDTVSDAFRKDRPWVVEQGKGGLVLRSGNASPLPLDRLNPSDRVKQIIERGEVKSAVPEFTADDATRAAFEKPHYMSYQERLTKQADEPTPSTVTKRQAVQQAKAAQSKAVASEAVATRAVVDLLDSPAANEEEADGKATEAEEGIKAAEQAFTKQVTAEAKLLPADGFPVAAPATIGYRGKAGTISQNGRDFEFHYELLPLGGLQTSHQWQGNRLIVNEEYPAELQPRTISESESIQNALRAERRSAMEPGRTTGYNFREYADSTINGQMGPAIVDESGRVVGGNTRTAIMRRHLDNLASISDPEQRDAEMAGFRAAMRKLAQDSGIENYPPDSGTYVVVRMLDKPIETTREAAEMGRLFNKSVSVQITKSARGVSYAKSIDKPLMQEIARRIAGNDGLNPAIKADPEFFAKIITDRFGVDPNEYADWGVEEPGRGLVMNEQGIQQFTKALMGTVIKDSALLNRIEGKTPYRALERSFGYLVQMQAIPDRDISGKIEEALQAAAETMNADPDLSRTRDKWMAAFHPDQIQLAGMETEVPPEPDRVVEALWRALHGSDASVPRVFNDRMKAWIGEESPLAISMFAPERMTPAEEFNRVFSKELREVQHLRGDKHEGITEDEFLAALKNRELSDVERQESREREEGISPDKGGSGESPEQPVEGDKTPSAGIQPPPKAPSKEREAARVLQVSKATEGYVTPDKLKEFLKTNPATKGNADELYRIAKMMSEYVAKDEGIETKDALDWVLRNRLAQIETSDLKGVRGQYGDPEVEKGWSDRVMMLHGAADASTFIHEFAHVIFPLLRDEDIKAIDTIEGTGGKRKWDGDRKNLSKDVYVSLSEKLANGLERFLRDENPTGFTTEIKNVLAKVKDFMRQIYLRFAKDPLGEYELTDEAREVFADMFGITDFDIADRWKDEVKKARAEEKKLKKPTEEQHPLSKLATQMGASSLVKSIDGKVEDSVGERVDPRKPIAVMRFDDMEKAVAAWAGVGMEGNEIKDAELVQTPEGNWGIRFNAKNNVPNSILFQELPRRHPGIELEELQQKLRGVPDSSPVRKFYEARIERLKNEIRARAGAEAKEEASPQAETAQQALQEVKNGRTNEVRAGADGKSGIQEPQRTGGFPKPPVVGVPRNAKPAGRSIERPPARTPRSLAEVNPVALEPIGNERGQPVGTTVGQSFDQRKWTDTLKRAGLPETLPAPTWALDPKTAQMLKFPGQKEVVQTALSALEQGDGVVIATATGTGKTYQATGIIREWRTQYPDAKVLYITKNAGLLRSAQKVAENTFGFNIERELGDDVKSGSTYGATYAKLMRDGSYKDKQWDLVIADESGEARNWFQPDSKQGKALIDVMAASKKGVYSSATPFHSPMEYGYLQKLNLWPKGGFDKWIENNFAHEKIGDKVVARLDPSKQAKLRQQLIERGQLISQAISYDGFTTHFGVVPVTDEMKRGLDRIHEGFARAKDFLYKSKRPGLAEKVAAFEATYTKAYLERERMPQAIELARRARAGGWQVAVFSETSSEDLFRRPQGEEPSTYQQLNEAMGGSLAKIIPPFPDIYDRLKAEFGDEIGDYSGRGNSLAERETAKSEFLKGETPIIYSTYAAGGIGVSLHDADFPELGVIGGDKPRIAVYLGPPYSGVLLEQAMGRFWRFGVKSDTHAVFLATDSEPDIKLLQGKVGPRMRALRAAVLGEKDSLANVMATYTDEEKVKARQDSLAYQEGNEVRVDATSFQVRSKTRNVGINDWSNIQFPSAEQAKNKGMKFGEEIPGGDWSTLFQSKFEFGPPPDENTDAGKEVINQIANDAVTGKMTPATEPVQNLDPADRDMATAAAAANASTDVDIQVDRDKSNTAKQTMEASMKDNALIPYVGITLSQEQGMVNIARLDRKPDVGYKLRTMNRAYRADRDVYVADKWSRIWDSLKANGIKEGDAKAIEEITLVLEGKKTTTNQRIQAVAEDLSRMMVEVHDDAAKVGVRVYRPGGKDSEGIGYSEFAANPKHFPHYIDWDREITDPATGEKVTVRELLNMDDRQRQRVIDSIPELKPYSYDQIMRHLRGNDPRAPRQGHINYTREINFPFIKRDYGSILRYFDEAAEAISQAKNFGPKEELLNGEIKKIENPRGQNTLNSMFRAALHPQDWDGRMSKLYNWAVAYEALSKMTLSAVKVPFHLVLTPMTLEGRVMPMVKAGLHVMRHPIEAGKEAAYAGAVIRQTNAAEMMFSERMSSPVRQILKKEMFESSYRLVRTVAYHSARVYLDQYAMNDLKKGGDREQAVRRLLRDVFTIGDHSIDQAIQKGTFEEEDVRRGEVAFTNYAAFSSTGDPLQMPSMARRESPRGTTSEMDSALNKSLRLTYALQSFSVKTASLLRERLYDEVVIHGNMRPLIYAAIAFPLVGQAIKVLGDGAKAIVHRGLEKTEQKKHQHDSWDDYIAYVSDILKRPDAAKALKAYIDGWSDSAGLEMLKTLADPLLNMAEGKPIKADQYWGDDAIQHLVGPFFSDLNEVKKEVEQLRKIQTSKQSAPVRHRKEKESIQKFTEGQFPILRQIPGFAPPPKPRR